MKNLLGGKGANLAEMSNLGLPVPPGFTVTTEVCTHYFDNTNHYPETLKAEVEAALGEVEKSLGRSFGATERPLLVSVRSGARASMPGMMDTVLNLGLNDETAAALAAETGDARFAYDSYRRFVQMYSDVVLGVDASAVGDDSGGGGAGQSVSGVEGEPHDRDGIEQRRVEGSGQLSAVSY